MVRDNCTICSDGFRKKKITIGISGRIRQDLVECLDEIELALVLICVSEVDTPRR